MDPTLAKNPKKKRRLDEVRDSQPGPSSHITPLTNPHLVKKSSKDPNRGMYPFRKGRLNHPSHSSSPQFIKASELYRQLQPSKEENSPCVLSAPCDSKAGPSIEQPSSSLRKWESNSEEDSSENEATFPKQPFSSKRSNYVNSYIKGKRATKFSQTGAANKISKYFKNSNPSNPRVVNRTDVSAVAQSSQSEAVQCFDSASARTSAWKKKDEEMLESLTQITNEQFFKNYRDCYGLVENAVIDDGGIDYFSILPTHIIENILCQIPMMDLMSCRVVCSKFTDIIDNDRFMEWKKYYYKMKLDFIPSNLPSALREILNQAGSKSVEEGIPTIIRYMGNKFNRMPSLDMFELLKSNPKGELADEVMSERFPDYNAKESRVWCQFALALLLCETVWDIIGLYKSLFKNKASCSRADVADAMYCVATFVRYYQQTGFHYRIYYALYLIENHIPTFQREQLKVVKGLHGQQSMHNYGDIDCSSLTFEQIRILNHKFDMNQKIRISALAGTGKTTTLLYLSKLYPQIKFLNLVFNKAVSDDAKKRFPQNVTCKTAHSLAFSVVGKLLRHKITTTLRPYDLIGHMKHNEEKIQMYSYAHLVLSTISNFTLSCATVIDLSHVPTKDFAKKEISAANRDRMLMDACKIWQRMLNQNDPFKITHDIYLKLYHLKQPNLSKYQCIMVDEAQDCNPVILDIVLSQTMPVIFVGDPYQQIYGFRGAKNAMQSFVPTHTYHLTKSFRFGPEISYIASCVLEITLNVKHSTIVGSTDDCYYDGKVSGQYAVIARTNMMLFNEALRIVVFKRLKASEPAVIKAAFAGGISSYGFDQISDIYRLKYLSKGEAPMKGGFISRFKSYSDMLNYARYADDSDLLHKVEIVTQHGHDIIKFISILKERCNHSIENANVIFSTAHKAKGLEFDTVCLTDDYPINTNHLTSLQEYYQRETLPEESNTLYVALTRAKKCLLLPEKMTNVFHLAFEKFEYPVASASIIANKDELKCVQCDTNFIPHTVLMLYRRKLILASEREIEEGPMCMKCGSDPYMRPDVHINGIIMYLDAIRDICHRFMVPIVGPLSGDPPIVHDRFAEFQNADRVFVINLNLH